MDLSSPLFKHLFIKVLHITPKFCKMEFRGIPLHRESEWLRIWITGNGDKSICKKRRY
jgi:hypothetical protein